MTIKPRKPAWLIPFALVILMGVALLLESRDGLPAWANDVAGVLIVLSVFAAIALWVRANMSAIMEEELREAGDEEFHITVYPPTKPSDGEEQEDFVHSYFTDDISRN
jgi:hypothetical protein